MTPTDRFKDGYASAERHWKARWHAANDDLQKAISENERLRAHVAAVEAALADHPRACDRDDDPITCGWKRAVADIEAVLSAAPTDTTKEN